MVTVSVPGGLSLSAVTGRAEIMDTVGPGGTEPHPELARAVAAHAASQGVLVLVTRTDGNVLRFLPPLTVSDALLEEAFDVVADGFAQALRG